MSRTYMEGLKRVIEARHGGTATFSESASVHEQHAGETVWDGFVHVFDLADHPTAHRAYAWSRKLAYDSRRFFAVLDREA
jgi:hypothetical protein